MNQCRLGRGVRMEVQATDRSYRCVSMVVVNPGDVKKTPFQRRGGEAIDRLGTPVQVLRQNAVVETTKAILQPLQRMSSPKTLAIIRTIWTKADDDIQGGDYIFDIARGFYYVFLAQNEYIAEGEIVGYASIVAKCNHAASIYRNVERPTGYGGVNTVFEEVERNIPVSLEFIKGGVRETEPGFFRQSTHRMFIPAFYGLSEMDRIKISDNFLRIDAIDTFSFNNVHYCTATRDDRPYESR